MPIGWELGGQYGAGQWGYLKEYNWGNDAY